MRLPGVFLIVVVLTGCNTGPELGQVSGSVSYKGKPVTFGIVSLKHSAGGPTSRADIQPDGTFTLATREGEGAAVGHNLVRVASFESQDPSRGGAEMVGLGKSLIPEHYSNYATSGLTYDVVPGENPPLVLDLKD